MSKSSNFQPNWASTPGDTIADILKDRQLTLPMFAKKMNSTIDHVRELLHGYVSITEEIAQKLEKVLGASVEFWLKRESQYRDSVYRLRNVEEEKWLKELPLKDMIKFGWLRESKNQVKECLDYFNVPDVWTWRRKYSEVTAITAFRKSSAIQSRSASVATWLRQGEIQSNLIDCKPWDPILFKETLLKIRPLTKKKNPKDFIPELTKKCAECGVALVIVKTPSGCSASGATKFITKDRTLILLSFRYLTDDHFWFTFFHEAGHLLLHGDRTLFIEDEDKSGKINKEEEDANNFSAELLIPKEFQQRLKRMRVNKRSLMDIAMDTDVSLGIIVGQLQHMGMIEYNHWNSFKRKYTWDDIS